ncbi:hypothetical protein [Falsiroseomonas tokyonensis]|uniref:TerB family tellurite resistance protein n=1 Tax=Falsiroseomonas tokyonensis TaxID=430521 RepID=A0ABV7BUF3_9PROT|nr:hypothetical protein [Falsiroseomonas tokyonensis]MBU8539233.1 hypothetical protein [Falsiroseomonas tokyonensis]
MSQEFLDDRRRALEEAFFARETEAWRQRQREAAAAASRREALQAASGITDTVLLDRLAGQGLEASTLAALSLVPLVMVGWADGTLDTKEREALLAAAAESGIGRDSPAYRSLTAWLASPPPASLLETWTDYIRASSAGMEDAARQALKAGLLDRARAVAQAAGGFLGLGARISPAEAAMLEKLDRAFAA